MAEIIVLTAEEFDRRLKELEASLQATVTETIRSHFKEREEPGPAGEGLLTKKEAAALLSVSTSTVDNYARAGRLTRHYIGKSVRFERREVLGLAKTKNSNEQQ